MSGSIAQGLTIREAFGADFTTTNLVSANIGGSVSLQVGTLDLRPNTNSTLASKHGLIVNDISIAGSFVATFGEADESEENLTDRLILGGDFSLRMFGNGKDLVDLRPNDQFRIGGRTRIETFGGDDFVKFDVKPENTGFLGFITILMGDGNDELRVSREGNTGAFANGGSFLFDGGAGSNTILIDRMGLTLLDAKIRNFTFG